MAAGMMRNERGKTKFHRDDFLKRLIQVGAVLSFLAFLCLAGGFGTGSVRKGFGEADADGKRKIASEVHFYAKKVQERVRTTNSFGALYESEEYDIPEKQLDFDALRREENPHIYAWITIPGTRIDYPVLQHPEKPDYYLNHNVDGSKGYPGCIYTQPYNSRDWSDNQTVLYGHNMKDGTMFADLHAYEEEAFFAENPYIYVYTSDAVLVYRVFAAYPFSDEHLLLNYDTETTDGYEAYLQEVRRAAESRGHYDEAAAPSTEDRIITLSTCIAQKPNQRYLVQGVMVTL